ncbi:MAG: heme ABC transporter ATP-binding protein [Candidatus Omnitrophica bacterium]|nr:heme ABC transporter ATP-binding protein [Candidatus Omnitrophota bacterium]MDD5574017.1 heme ABC transporter ATP-binding protein [Candidatus Omnitrophota bacterium]
MNNLITVRNLTGGYGHTPVLRGISFSVRKGETIGIIGPNGSGKSTLLRLISRALTPQAGEVLLEGKNIRTFSLKEFCKRVAFVGQETPTEFSFSSREIVAMGRIPYLRRLESETKDDKEAIMEAMRLTDVLGLAQRETNTLSAGERQRVILARALAQKTNLILLDEPTSHLDIGHQAQILDLLRGLNRRSHLTIVMVIHDLNLAGEYCDRLILLHEGRIVQEGTPEEILTYQNLETVYKTVVVVKKNPISQKPYIILIPQDQLCRQNLS